MFQNSNLRASMVASAVSGIPDWNRLGLAGIEKLENGVDLDDLLSY